MKAQEMLIRLQKMEKSVLKNRSHDTQTKYQTIAFMKAMEKLIRYQLPIPPINVSEDGHLFECPTCGTKFESEDTVDDFNLCYTCGQRFKEVEE